VTLSVVLLLAAFVPAVAFPLLYLRSPWRSTIVGRSVMTLAVVIALALALPLSRIALGDPEWLQAVRLVVFVLIVVALWQQLIVLVTVQRRQRRRDKENA
jgi:hypothetical protein